MLKRKLHYAFLFLLVSGLVLTLATYYRRYHIFSVYENPMPVFLFSIAFDYIAFSLVAFLFPWSWKKALNRWVWVGMTGLVFVITYLFFSSLIEWLESARPYSFISGFKFTLMHSGPYTILVYGLISVCLFFLIKRSDDKGNQKFPDRIPIRKKNQTFILELDNVFLIEADGNYLSLYLDDEKYLMRKTLKEFEKQLDPNRFIRIHRKFIINKSFVQTLKADVNGGYLITLLHGKTVKMSKSYLSELSKLKETQ